MPRLPLSPRHMPMSCKTSLGVIVLNTFEDFYSSILTVNWSWLLKDVGKLKAFVADSRDSPMTVCLFQAMARSVKMPQRWKKLVCVERNFGLVGRWGCAWQCNWKQGTKMAIFSSFSSDTSFKLQCLNVLSFDFVFFQLNGCNQFITTFVASWWLFFVSSSHLWALKCTWAVAIPPLRESSC
jgi:hypothetical protein